MAPSAGLGDTRSVGMLFERRQGAERGFEVDRLIGKLEHQLGVGPASARVVGRYVIGDRIGSGGFGVVYRASDPQLGRDVAVKVLRDTGAAPGQRRLLEEARVLAGIEHPNVLQVFDVGSFDDHGVVRTFIAMELFEAGDLRRWLGKPRSMLEVVRVFMAAAEGLAAAHERGVLHRDFKPGNVLVAEDGTIRVADFGLAAMAESASSLPTRHAGARSGDETRSPAAGTPRYMAPEQHQGNPLSAAADQYALFVSLFEALHGRPPFCGRSVGTLIEAKMAGPASLRFDRRVPAALAAAIRRGLAPRPADRFADMRDVRRALERVVARRPRRILLAFGLTALAATLAFYEPSHETTSCHGAPTLAVPSDALELDPELERRRAELDRELEEYHHQLANHWRGTCALPVERRAAVQDCLSEASRAASELRVALAEQRSAVVRGWSVLDTLPSVQLCDEPATEAQRFRWVAASARARLHRALGDFERARGVWLDVREQAEALGEVQEIRHVDLALAGIALDQGDPEAVEAIESVYFRSDAAGDAHTAATAAIELLAVYARSGREPSRWERAARTQLERFQPRDPVQELNFAHNLAVAHLVAGRLAVARITLEEALVLATEHGVAGDPVAGTHRLYAEVLLHNGRPSEALAVHRRELQDEGARRSLDDEVITKLSLGNALLTQRDFGAACEVLWDARERAVSFLGRDHPTFGTASINLGYCLLETDRLAEAQEVLTGARRLLAEQLGEDHAYTAVAEVLLGRVAVARGRLAGLARMERAIDALETALGVDHYVVLDARHSLGTAYAQSGQLPKASRILDDVLRRRLVQLPDGHVDIYETMAQAALVSAATGAHNRAVTLMTEAIAGFDDRGVDPSHVSRFQEILERWG